ncbi:hypothetical protein [Mycobacterium asiaticum]|uniref:hypothetical protein n=1 Tax=Mycobacterium asiaticum TaxID=1790 RepID=UPI0012DB0FA1|nr:hypothetical protein [Mycobacterium asiaticum]
MRSEQASRVAADLQAVSRAAKQNPALFGPILMSMFERRCHAVAADQSTLPMDAWYGLANVPLADHLLSRTGAGWPPSKDVVVSVDWVSTMRWGLDHFVFLTYLVRGGRFVAAALTARMFLERWSLNVAHHHGVEPRDGESDADFITRAWAVYPELSSAHDMGRYWRLLSEYLHGRAALEEAIAADSISLGEFIATVGRVTLTQVLGAIRVHAEAHGLTALAATLHKYSAVPLTHDSWSEDPLLVNSLHQMDFGFTMSEVATALSEEASKYRNLVGDRAAGPMLRDTLSIGLGRLAFVERRGRAIDVARDNFRHEANLFGADFDPGSLNARLFRYIGIGELARLMAFATPSNNERRALLSAADALESAWFVWLEDSDLSLACVRVLLEQTSRARAHRLKSSRAQALEKLPVSAAPSRWLELAGFRRLAAYNRALGQFAHIQQNLRLAGARTLLEKVQAAPGEYPEFTARGDALNEAAYLLAHELSTRLDDTMPWLTVMFREAVTLKPAEDHEAALADMLDRSLGHRDLDLGPNLFVTPQPGVLATVEVSATRDGVGSSQRRNTGGFSEASRVANKSAGQRSSSTIRGR